MLTRLETIYLGLLRVIVLVAATIALLVTVVGVASAIPPLIDRLGWTEPSRPNGGSLAEFITEQKITSTVAEAGRSEGETPFVLADVKIAAKAIRQYLGERSAISVETLEKALQTQAESLPDHSLEYAASLKGLTSELKLSRGTPLSEARVIQLMDWHKARFLASVELKAARDLKSANDFTLKMGLTGAAFLTFVLIVFVFLFVKIERNLRVFQVSGIIHGASDEDEQ